MDHGGGTVLKILTQTSGYLLCVKPRGVSSEAGEGGMPELIAQALGISPERVFPVHRLDRETGGVMVYALTKPAAAVLSAGIAEGKLQKEYLAVTEGLPETSSGQWKDLLYWDRTKRKSYPVGRLRKGVKEAELSFEVLGRTEQNALLRIAPRTGRTHQIRVQCASRGLPLWGDGRYGGKEKQGFGLWCRSIAFPDPNGNGLIRAQADPPDESPWSLFFPIESQGQDVQETAE